MLNYQRVHLVWGAILLDFSWPDHGSWSGIAGSRNHERFNGPRPPEEWSLAMMVVLVVDDGAGLMVVSWTLQGIQCRSLVRKTKRGYWWCGSCVVLLARQVQFFCETSQFDPMRWRCSQEVLVPFWEKSAGAPKGNIVSGWELLVHSGGSMWILYNFV